MRHNSANGNAPTITVAANMGANNSPGWVPPADRYSPGTATPVSVINAPKAYTPPMMRKSQRSSAAATCRNVAGTKKPTIRVRSPIAWVWGSAASHMDVDHAVSDSP